jgi:hypothetical protein
MKKKLRKKKGKNKMISNSRPLPNRPLLWREPIHAWTAYHPDYVKPIRPSLEGPDEVAIKDLCQRLLSIGGKRVEVPDMWDEDYCQDFVDDGQFFPTESIIAGGRKDCCPYHNCKNLWQNNQEKYRIVDGFDLHKGTWSHHIWVVTGDNRIVDTTSKAKYFGMILDNETAGMICDEDDSCE